MAKTAAYTGGAIIAEITGSRLRGASGKIDNTINEANRFWTGLADYGFV